MMVNNAVYLELRESQRELAIFLSGCQLLMKVLVLDKNSTAAHSLQKYLSILCFVLIS